MRPYFQFLYTLCCCMLCLASACAAERLSVVVEQYQPFAIEAASGKSGIAVEVVTEAARRAGMELDIQVMPLTRIRMLMQRGSADISIAESPLWFDEAGRADFVFSEPYARVYESVYFAQGRGLQITQAADLKGKLVGIHRGYFYAAFDPLFRDKTVRLDESDDSETLVQKLIKGRIDALLLDNLELGYVLKKLGMAPSAVVRSIQLTDSPVCVMVRKSRANVLDVLNPQLRALKTEGMIDRTIRRYSGDADLSRK